MRAEFERRLEALERVSAHEAQKRAEIDGLNIRPHIAAVYYPLHEDIEAARHEFINLPGGRGSGKSSFCALEIVLQMMRDKTGQSNALIVRKYAVTLRGSVFSQIQWAIDTLGVGQRWRATLTPMQFVYETGQVITFTGLDDPQKLKSLKPSRGYYRYLWLEEFSEINGEPELRNLQQSVLRGGDVFTVFRSFNPPISAANWANQFIQRPDDRSVTLHTTYKDVPSEWLGQAFIDEAERLKTVNERAYEHEYMGRAIGNGSEVFENLTIRKITDDEYNGLQYVYAGLDFGFASDPACFIRVAYDRKTDTITVMDELYKRGLSNATLAEMIRERKLDTWRDSKYYSVMFGSSMDTGILITADSAEPKSIADLNGLGLKVRPCHKEPGCVQYRLKWLQQRRIVIDPARTPNTAREMQNYCYNVDRKSGEILSSVPDKDNHSIDALAYSLNGLIYTKSVSA